MPLLFRILIIFRVRIKITAHKNIRDGLFPGACSRNWNWRGRNSFSTRKCDCVLPVRPTLAFVIFKKGLTVKVSPRSPTRFVAC